MRRLRDVEWSPWLVLVFLVPLVNLIFLLVLFFVPSKPGADAQQTAAAFQ